MSQSLSQLWVHAIFSTKMRHPFMKEKAIQQRIHQYIGGICNKLNCHALSIGGTEDHIHLLTSLNKNISLSQLIEQVKKSSSRWIKMLEGSGGILSQFHWQKGYGAFSVSQSNINIVKHYIENQESHHKKQSFQDELRLLLTKYQIPYDEKYLWD